MALFKMTSLNPYAVNVDLAKSRPLSLSLISSHLLRAVHFVLSHVRGRANLLKRFDKVFDKIKETIYNYTHKFFPIVVKC